MQANTPRAAPAPHRYPLHVHIATLAIALLFLSSGVYRECAER